MPPTPSQPSRHEASGLQRSLGVPTRSLQLPSFSPQPVVSDPSGPGLSRSVPSQPHPSARSLGSQCPKRPGPRPRPTDSPQPHLQTTSFLGRSLGSRRPLPRSACPAPSHSLRPDASACSLAHMAHSICPIAATNEAGLGWNTEDRASAASQPRVPAPPPAP